MLIYFDNAAKSPGECSALTNDDLEDMTGASPLHEVQTIGVAGLCGPVQCRDYLSLASARNALGMGTRLNRGVALFVARGMAAMRIASSCAIC